LLPFFFSLFREIVSFRSDTDVANPGNRSQQQQSLSKNCNNSDFPKNILDENHRKKKSSSGRNEWNAYIYREFHQYLLIQLESWANSLPPPEATNELLYLHSSSYSYPMNAMSSLQSSSSSLSPVKEISGKGVLKAGQKKEEALNLPEFVLLLCCVGVQVKRSIHSFICSYRFFSICCAGISEYDI
jgi:hypothetical protein